MSDIVVFLVVGVYLHFLIVIYLQDADIINMSC